MEWMLGPLRPDEEMPDRGAAARGTHSVVTVKLAPTSYFLLEKGYNLFIQSSEERRRK